MLAQDLHRRRRIVDGFRFIKPLIKLEGALPFGVRLIGQLYTRLLPPEKIRAEHDEPERRIMIGDVAHHLIDTENFLHQNNARPLAARRHGQIARKFTAIECLDSNHWLDLSIKNNSSPANSRLSSSTTFKTSQSTPGLIIA